MGSSPCDCWSHLSPSSSSLSQTLFSSSSYSSSSIEHVWDDIKLPPLSLNHPPPSTLLTVTSTSTSTSTSESESLFHKRLSHCNNRITITPKQDQRHMRIIKNRESAVRSRARKQAYRKGLEVEIARLTEENSKLRTQLKQYL
ncbi:bZIP transcription factor 27, partial [Mucuna pruriens]